MTTHEKPFDDTWQQKHDKNPALCEFTYHTSGYQNGAERDR